MHSIESKLFVIANFGSVFIKRLQTFSIFSTFFTFFNVFLFLSERLLHLCFEQSSEAARSDANTSRLNLFQARQLTAIGGLISFRTRTVNRTSEWSEMKPPTCTPWSKIQDTQLLSIPSPNIDRFSKFFHWYTQQEICNNDIIADPATP